MPPVASAWHGGTGRRWLVGTHRSGQSPRQFHEAEERIQVAQESATKTGEVRADDEREKEKLLQQLDDYKIKRNRILFMAWLSSLTLRIGIVVLLLFLTQILLSTFRYTMAIASFYLGRSDAIQLLPEKAAGGFDIPDLKELVGLTTPGELKIDSVKDPSD